MTPQTSHCYRLLQLSRTPRIPSIPRSPLPTGPPCWVASAADFPHLASFVQSTRRTVGSVPGPLEARRRLGKRNLGDLNALQCPPTPPPWAFPYPVDLSQWNWEPPSSASAQHVAFDRTAIGFDNSAPTDLLDNADFFVSGWTAHQDLRQSRNEPITPQFLEQCAIEEGIHSFEDTQHSTQDDVPYNEPLTAEAETESFEDTQHSARHDIPSDDAWSAQEKTESLEDTQYSTPNETPYEGWPSQKSPEAPIVEVTSSKNNSHSTTASDIFDETGNFTWDPTAQHTDTLEHSDYHIITAKLSTEVDIKGPEDTQHSAQQHLSWEEGSLHGALDRSFTVDLKTATSTDTRHSTTAPDVFDDSGFFTSVPESEIDPKNKKPKDQWISQETFMEQWSTSEPPEEAKPTKPESTNPSALRLPAWFKDPETISLRSLRREGDLQSFSEALGQTMPEELENMERDVELETSGPEAVREEETEEDILEEEPQSPSAQYLNLRQDVDRLHAASTEPLAIFAELFSGICANLKQNIALGEISAIELRAISHELIRTIQERWGEDEEMMQTHYSALYNMTQAQLAVFLKTIIDGVRSSETLTADAVEPAFWRQFFEWMSKLEPGNDLYYLFYWGMRTVSQPGIKKGMEGILTVLERILTTWAAQPPGTTDLGEGPDGGQLSEADKATLNVDEEDIDESDFDNNDLDQVKFHEDVTEEVDIDPNQDLYLEWPPPDPKSISCVDSVLFALNVRSRGENPQRNCLHVRWVSAALEALSPHKHSILFDAATELVLQLGSSPEGMGSPVVYNWLSVLAQMDGVNTQILCDAIDAFKTVPETIEHLGNFHMCSLMLFHWASRNRLKRRFLTARLYRHKHEAYQVGLDNSQLACLAMAIYESEPATNHALLFTSMFHILRSFNRVHHLPRALKKFARRGFINRTLLEDLAYLCDDHKVALKMRRIWEAYAWKKRAIGPVFREKMEKMMNSKMPPKMDDGDKHAPFSTHVYLKYAKAIIADPSIRISTIWKVLDIPRFEEAFDPDRVSLEDQRKRLSLHGNVGDKRATVVAQIAPLFASVEHLSDRQKYRLMQQSISYLEEVEAIKAARGMGGLTDQDIQSTVQHTLDSRYCESSDRDAIHQPNPWNQGLSADVLMALYKVVTKDLVMGRPGRETRLRYFIQCMERHYGPEVARATRQKLVDWRTKLYEQDKPNSYQVRRRRELKQMASC
ncbi:hypothetical protein GE21DRAFT_2521 [Neurospora crassa]|uniref:Uncharacterized protein n=1 Tax=Neurospora crassa (strain ATCC 24698 / 74-OR23-1A / CBS 708.71 / DSM 1257 / FGSC 987) TaxID=367110 RepID=Q7SE24_NEUCR|nr:hypothetical protein NCU02770 [Neurospora crassa OR74A]EAA35029.1 hypothetical protein NCU02770 [Neurospora crassa OR74A]KHE87285.1 hypothetical protein GE21DRAFT_2521 [Neurospora crassa]|eukprot:XP_964265.1 hypothetical protein NCU02770 [Neurospora crassa OR74A]